MKRLNRRHFYLFVFIFIIIQLLIFLINSISLWKSFEDKTNWITQFIVMNTKEILWEYDLNSLQEVLSAFTELEEVSGIQVTDALLEQTFLMGVKPQLDYLKTATRKIQHNGQYLGQIDIYFSNQHINKTFYEMLSKLVLEAVFLLVLFFCLFYFISKKYSQPIHDLSNIIKRFEIGNPNIPGEQAIKTNIDEIKEIFRNYREMAKEVSSNYSKLERSNIRNNHMTKKLAKIIEISEKFDRATEMSEKSFMKQLFRNAFEITPEADYGSVYFYKNGYVEFLDAIGHNKKILKKISIPEKLMRKNENGELIIKNTIQVVDFQKKWLKVKEEHQQLFDSFQGALMNYKQTMYFELYLDGAPIGGLNLDISEGSDLSFSQESIDAMNAFKSIANAFYKIQHYSRIKENFTREMMLSIIKMLEIHDSYTKGHSENVAMLSSKLAKKLNLSKSEQDEAYWAGLVHDIGKILIPDAILNKQTRLTEDEFEFIKKHPVWGYETLKSFENLSVIASDVLYHHESWDGKGYPNGLKQKEIPLISRIISIADSWDAMTSKRAYRKPLKFEDAIRELSSNAGKQFDPEFTEVFIKMMKQERIKTRKKEKVKV